MGVDWTVGELAARAAGSRTNYIGLNQDITAMPGEVNGTPADVDEDVRAFGAKLDGFTDDTAAFTRALQSGKRILVPPGRSVLGGLSIDSGQNLVCAGRETSKLLLNGPIKTKGFDGLTQGLHGTGAGTVSSPFNFGIRGCTIDASGLPNGTTAVSFYGYGFTFYDFVIRGSKGVGLWTEWAAQSTSPGNDSMEAYVAFFKIHDSSGTGWVHRGPHDLHGSQAHIYANGGGSTANYGIDIPEDTFANGSNLSGIHVWGGTYGWAYHVKSSGVRLNNVIGEGGQLGQMQIDAAQVQVEGHFYTGGVNVTTAKSVQLTNNANGCYIRGHWENCGGGFDLGTGDNHDIDVHVFDYASSLTAGATTINGTIRDRTRIRVYATDKNFAPTASCVNQVPGRSRYKTVDDAITALEAQQNSATQTASIRKILASDGSTLQKEDNWGRPAIGGITLSTPAIAVGANNTGSGGAAALVTTGGATNVDYCFRVDITPGGTATAGVMAEAAFAHSYGATPIPQITALNDAAAQALVAGVYVTPATNKLQIAFRNPGAVSGQSCRLAVWTVGG